MSATEKRGRRKKLKNNIVTPSFKPKKRGRGRRKGHKYKKPDETDSEPEEMPAIDFSDILSGSENEEYSDDPQDSDEMEEERIEILDFVRFLNHLNAETEMPVTEIKEQIAKDVPPRVLRRLNKLQRLHFSKTPTEESLLAAQQLERIIKNTRQDAQETKEQAMILREKPSKLLGKVNLSRIFNDIRNFSSFYLKGISELAHRVGRRRGIESFDPDSMIAIIMSLDHWFRTLLEMLVEVSRRRDEMGRRYFEPRAPFDPTMYRRECLSKTYSIIAQIPPGNYAIYNGLLEQKIKWREKNIQYCQGKLSQGEDVALWSRRLAEARNKINQSNAELESLKRKKTQPTPQGVRFLWELLNKMQYDKRITSKFRKMVYCPVPASEMHVRPRQPR